MTMTGETKLRFLREAALRDAEHPQLRGIAGELWEAAGKRSRIFAILAHALAGRGIRQIWDTRRVGGEDIAGLTREERPTDAIEAWHRGEDDCDAKARFFVALCTAVGIPAIVEPMWGAGEPRELAHVYARVYLDRAWNDVELTLARAVIGEGPLVVPREADGSRLRT